MKAIRQRNKLTAPNAWGLDNILAELVISTATTTPTSSNIASLIKRHDIAIRTELWTESRRWYRRQALKTSHEGIPHIIATTKLSPANNLGSCPMSILRFSSPQPHLTKVAFGALHATFPF
jgi:hypothetical protein